LDGSNFQSFNQSEHIIGPGSHVGFPICTKITYLVEDLPMTISAKFGLNLFCGFREEDENMKSFFRIIKKMSEVPVGAPTVMAHGRLQMYS
jgi:hypothetical protein